MDLYSLNGATVVSTDSQIALHDQSMVTRSTDACANNRSIDRSARSIDRANRSLLHNVDLLLSYGVDRWGPIGSDCAIMGSDWVISHTRPGHLELYVVYIGTGTDKRMQLWRQCCHYYSTLWGAEDCEQPVCLSARVPVDVSVCPRTYLWKHWMDDLHEILCAYFRRPSLGPHPAVWRYII